jgi:hypothetical protein
MQSSAPDDGRKNRPKHVEPTWNNKLIYIVHLVGYFHSCITMHGFINAKKLFSWRSAAVTFLEGHMLADIFFLEWDLKLRGRWSDSGFQWLYCGYLRRVKRSAGGLLWLLCLSVWTFGFRKRGFLKTQVSLCLTLRRLMSYIYGAPILDVSRSHTTTQHSR